MTLKNPEDNRHQLPGSGDQQAAVKGWILGVTTGTTVPDHRRTNSSLDCTFTLRYFCACKTGIQLILWHQNFKDHTSNKTLKITLVTLIACLSSWWMVLEPNFSSNVQNLICYNSVSSYWFWFLEGTLCKARMTVITICHWLWTNRLKKIMSRVVTFMNQIWEKKSKGSIQAAKG